MAKSRFELHEILCGLLGSRNVYFRPPESIKMSYDAIVYDRENYQNTFADNSIYQQMKRYSVTAITKKADSDLPDKIMQLPFCSFDRHFVSDNLNHDVFTLYY